MPKRWGYPLRSRRIGALYDRRGREECTCHLAVRTIARVGPAPGHIGRSYRPGAREIIDLIGDKRGKKEPVEIIPQGGFPRGAAPVPRRSDRGEQACR